MKDFRGASPENKGKALVAAPEKLKKLPRADYAQRSLELAQSIGPKDATSFPALMYALNLSRDSGHPEIAVEFSQSWHKGAMPLI